MAGQLGYTRRHTVEHAVGRTGADDKALTELVNKALSGDGAARQTLFARLRDVAWQTAQGRLKGQTVRGVSAQDVAQDAMLKLVRKIESLPADCDPKIRAYVATTVANIFRGHLRSGRVKAQAEQRAAVEPVSPLPSPSRQVHLNDGIDQARVAAVTELSKEQRAAFLLLFGERLSVAESAARMKCSEKAILQLIDRAIEAISAHISRADKSIPAAPREARRRALHQYLRATESGNSVEPAEFLRRYPKHAAALSPLLDELEQVRRVVQRLGE